MEEPRYQIVAFDPAKSLQLFDVSKKLLASGLYPNLKTPEAAFAVVQYGAELGYGPMVSLQNIQMVQGKPSCSAQFLLAQMKRSGWSYKIVESSDKRCCLEFCNGGKQSSQIEYTIEEARTAGLLNKSGDMWKKYPKDMLFSRCSSRAARRLSPEAILGMYTEEEMEVDSPPAIGPENAKNITPTQPPPEEQPQQPHPIEEVIPPYWGNL